MLDASNSRKANRAGLKRTKAKTKARLTLLPPLTPAKIPAAPIEKADEKT
jgi:hypothetical protein